jgi:hypothetical protein
MQIRFLRNDPFVPNAKASVIVPFADRPAGRATFRFFNAVPARSYKLRSREFVFWQCREAALRTVAVWESVAGPLTQWARSADRTTLDLNQIMAAEPQLNAFYDGEGLRFFEFPLSDGTETIFSAMSTDTVAHEAGHALLDTIRPDFWTSFFPEVGAYHEAFGDCMSILTALSDDPTRKALLKLTPALDQPNFVEAGSEYLSEAIRREFGDNVAPAKPRRALNDFQWQLPTTLPAGTFEDPPELLSAEVHSFCRVFSGCFWDVIRFIFAGKSKKNSSTLLESTRTAGALLVAATKNATHTPRFFQAVGRAMVLADQQLNAGANREAIGKAFARHNLGLGSSAMLQPTAALSGPAPTFEAAAARLTPNVTRDLRKRLHVSDGARLSIAPTPVAPNVASATHEREVPLGGIDRRLRNVVALAPESVLVGASGTRAAILGAMPEPSRTTDEVQAFVESLVAHDQIQYDVSPTRRGAALVAAAADKESPRPVTHAIVQKGEQKVLTRIRFVH